MVVMNMDRIWIDKPLHENILSGQIKCACMFLDECVKSVLPD